MNAALRARSDHYSVASEWLSVFMNAVLGKNSCSAWELILDKLLILASHKMFYKHYIL